MTAPVARLRRQVDGDGNLLGGSVWTWCPGCDSLHPFRVELEGKRPDGPVWEWDGRLDPPTFSPSLLCHDSVHICQGEHDPVLCEEYDTCDVESHALGALIDDAPVWRFPHGMPDEYVAIRGHTQPHTREPASGPCHSFLRAGRWEFLSDSAHHLAGQTVDMVPLPGAWSE